MSNRELPMMPWFPDQFAASTACWTYAERSAYRGLLDVQWAIGVLPTEPWRLAHALGMPLDEFEIVWPVVSQKFQQVEGGLRNSRLEEHRLAALELHRKKSAAGRLGGLSRQAQSKHHSSTASSISSTATSSSASFLLEAKLKPLSPSPSLKNKTLPPYPPSRKRAANGQGGRGAHERSREAGAIREDDPEVRRKRKEAETLAAQHAKSRDDDDGTVF